MRQYTLSIKKNLVLNNLMTFLKDNKKDIYQNYQLRPVNITPYTWFIKYHTS